jgi:hypothetical protein
MTTKRNSQGQFQAAPTAAEYARTRRVNNVKSVLLERLYGDEAACASKATELVTYAFHAAVVERRDPDEVLRSCLKYLASETK